VSTVIVVAAFDFDGTLSTRDNVVPFLRAVAGSRATAQAMAATAATLGRRDRTSSARDALKAGVTRRLLGGRSATDVDATAKTFATDVVARHLRAEALARADWHRREGHRLVIVSASFGVYLRPIAEALGFDAALGTELEVAPDGVLTGRLMGLNVRRTEKVRRLDEWLATTLAGTAPYVWAYGNSRGDRELWARANRAVRMGRRARRGTQ
jgi:phosphatidylglycerophosphatase C